jgi:hypothetical protein
MYYKISYRYRLFRLFHNTIQLAQLRGKLVLEKIMVLDK